jgi:pyrroloquinoline quinone biosynthesis protein B
MNFRDSQVTAVVLGMMQDGGLPHAGCRCPRCTAALHDPGRRLNAASLALVDRRGVQTAVWLVDATPDIGWQLALLAEALGPHPARPGRLRQPDGILLTHAHMGHIGGLMQLGPEAMAVEGLPLIAAPPLLALLSGTALWKPALAGLQPRPLAAGETMALAADLQITAVAVPHRDEWGVGTVAFHVQGPRRSLLYLPDIDAWDAWPEAQVWLEGVDVALVDATFFSMAELGGRAPVAHPLVTDTLERFGDIPGQLVLTHLNHTNPLLDAQSREQRLVTAQGVHIAAQGMTFQL